MITARLKLPLEQDEYLALSKVAELELRNPVDQVRFILRKELGRLGFLQTGTIEAIQIEDPKPEPKGESCVTA
jgi:hypothetical protein